MEEARRKVRQETAPRGSRVDILRKFLDGDPASRMKIDLDAEDSQSSESSGPATRPRCKGRGKTSERPRGPAKWHPQNSYPFVTCSDGVGRDRRHRREQILCKAGVPRACGGGGEDTPSSSGRGAPTSLPQQRKQFRTTPPRDPDADGETWTPTTTWHLAKTPTHPAAEDPRRTDRPVPQAEDRPEDCREGDHLVHHRAEGPQTEGPLEDHQAGTPPTIRQGWTSPRTSGDGSCTSRGRSGTWSARHRSTRSRSARARLSHQGPEGPGHRQVRGLDTERRGHQAAEEDGQDGRPGEQRKRPAVPSGVGVQRQLGTQASLTLTARTDTQMTLTARADTQMTLTPRAKTQMTLTARAHTQMTLRARANNQMTLTARANTQMTLTARADTQMTLTARANTQMTLTAHADTQMTLTARADTQLHS